MAGVHIELASGSTADGASFSFTANSTGATLTLASMFDAATIAANTVFNITVPAGITIKGPTGAVGNPAGAGGPAFDFSRVSGKIINIVNSGSISGGNGGNGITTNYYWKWNTSYQVGNAQFGGWSTSYVAGPCGPSDDVYSSSPTAGGAGGAAITNGSNTVTVSGNATVAGTAGANGGAVYYYAADNCDCSSCSSCFVAGTLVNMYDGTKKPIENVAIGDIVLGAFEEPNIVNYLKRPSGIGQDIYNVNGVLTSPEHPFLNGDRTGFNFISLEAASKLKNSHHDVIDGEGKVVSIFLEGLKTTPVKEFNSEGCDTVYTVDGAVSAVIELTDIKVETLYHLVLGCGSKTYCANGVFVAGFADDESLAKMHRYNEALEMFPPKIEDQVLID